MAKLQELSTECFFLEFLIDDSGSMRTQARTSRRSQALGDCEPRLFRVLHVVCCMPNVACRTLCCMDNSGSASPCWHLPDAGMMSCAASV